MPYRRTPTIVSQSSRDSHPVGFTLVELLMVVAIIAVLISILLPALNKARELTKQTLCLTRLKTIYLGVMTYAMDFNDYPPYIGNAGGAPLPRYYYMDGFYRYGTGTDAPTSTSGKKIASEAFVCPSNLEPAQSNYRYSTYGFNMLFGGYTGAGGNDYCQFLKLTRPSITPLMGDRQGGAAPIIYNGSLISTNTNITKHVFRHLNLTAMSLLRCDGQVETVLQSTVDADYPLYPYPSLGNYNTWRPRYTGP